MCRRGVGGFSTGDIEEGLLSISPRAYLVAGRSSRMSCLAITRQTPSPTSPNSCYESGGQGALELADVLIPKLALSWVRMVLPLVPDGWIWPGIHVDAAHVPRHSQPNDVPTCAVHTP